MQNVKGKMAVSLRDRFHAAARAAQRSAASQSSKPHHNFDFYILIFALGEGGPMVRRFC
jgi:hypothetical protein